MKISSPIYNNKIQNYNNKQSSNQTYKAERQYDSFEKTTNTVNFKGISGEFSKRADDFSMEMMRLMATGRIELDEIEKVVEKHSCDTGFGLLDSNQAKSVNANAAHIGYLKAPMGISPNGKAQLLDKRTILTTLPRDGSFEEFVRTYAQITHEFGHSIQYDYPEKSRLGLINKFLSNNILDQKTIATVAQANNVFKGVETSVLMPLITTLRGTYIPREISEAPSVVLEKLLTPKLGNMDEYIKKSTMHAISTAEKQIGPMNHNYVLSFIKLVAENESEAYQQETKFIKTVHNMKSDTHLDITPVLFDRMANVMGKMLSK